MQKLIPKIILKIYKKLQENNFEVYLVGGSVRNLIMKLPVKDWDLTTNATPEEMLKLFPDGFYDNTFGTVGIPIEKDGKNQVVEVTTFRTEHGYTDRRRPDKVLWGKTIEEDLARRDFTINAIALHLEGGRLALSEAEGMDYFEVNKTELIDPFNGKKDIENKLIRAVGDPDQRFKEDALRLLRAIRIATELSFTIEEKTWKELVTDAPLITQISEERIQIELMRILASNYPYDGIMLLRNSTLLEQIIPELLKGVGVSQVRPGRHHTTDVFTHNVLSLKYTPSTDPIVRFAALLHDVGKPYVASTDEHGLVIFHNHEIVGAKMAKEICERLKFSKKEREKIVNLIRWHMFTVDEKITDAAVRRFIRRVGVENVKDMMDLRIGDRLGGGTQTAESWRLKLFKKRVEDQLKPAPFSINDLVIDGNDVMKELNIKPGPKVGEILQKLFEEVDEDLSRNNREYLLKRIHELD
ncbi:MAG: CCA tRNA nucleotidyltransferase [Candidatus Levybacteria bacterium]|nr:CCA tRNA nucleotidyltransferase [Candidatus Levybacteria bacterium]